MLIRILLVVVILVLLFVANYLNKNNVSFSKVLADDTRQGLIQTTFKQFAKTCLFLAIIGLICLFFGHRMLAIGYIAVIMLASAVFSIQLSKLIS